MQLPQNRKPPSMAAYHVDWLETKKSRLRSMVTRGYSVQTCDVVQPTDTRFKPWSALDRLEALFKVTLRLVIPPMSKRQYAILVQVRECGASSMLLRSL